MSCSAADHLGRVLLRTGWVVGLAGTSEPAYYLLNRGIKLIAKTNQANRNGYYSSVSVSRLLALKDR